jgi:hypothetical protein
MNNNSSVKTFLLKRKNKEKEEELEEEENLDFKLGKPMII